MDAIVARVKATAVSVGLPLDSMLSYVHAKREVEFLYAVGRNIHTAHNPRVPRDPGFTIDEAARAQIYMHTHTHTHLHTQHGRMHVYSHPERLGDMV